MSTILLILFNSEHISDKTGEIERQRKGKGVKVYLTTQGAVTG